MNINKSSTLESMRIIEDRRNNKQQVFNGGLGENPFPLIQQIQQYLTMYSNKKEYTRPNGITPLREIISKNSSNNKYKVDDVIIGNGLKELLFILLLVLHQLDFYLFLITPCWVSYIEHSKIIRMNTIFVKTNHKENYKIDIDNLKKHFEKYHDKNKVILFNNPVNPTGVVYTIEEVEKLSLLFKEYNVLVISDEI